MTDEMTYEVFFDSEERRVRLVAHGRFVEGQVGPMVMEGIEVSNLHDCPDLLIDFRDAAFDIPNHAVYDFMSGLGRLGLDTTMTVAVVYARDREVHLFAETVARNRGWYGIRYFGDWNEAEEWIRERQAARTAEE